MPTSRNYNPANADDPPEPESQAHFEAFIRPPLRRIDKYSEPKIAGLSQRSTVAVMAFLGFAVIYGTRFNLKMAREYFKDVESAWKPKNQRVHHWSIDYQLDSHLFLSNLVAQIPGGLLAYKFPANKVFGLGVVCPAVLNILLLMVTKYHAVSVVVYFLQGFAQGIKTTNFMQGIWRFWAPPLERTKLTTIALSGMYAGMMLGTLICEHLSASIHPSVMFDFFGLLGIVWFGFWYWLVLQKPRDHPAITEQELMYIENSLGESTKLKATCIPWIKIFTSLPVYAIMIATFCQKWSYFFVGYYQSRFFEHNYAFRIGEKGLIAVLPYIMMLIILPAGGFLADFCRQRRFLSTTNVRKIFLCLSFGFQGLCLFYVPQMSAASSALLLLLACNTFSGLAVSGFIVNHLDIAPRFASIIIGISNTFGFIAGIICPMVTEVLTSDMTSKQIWDSVFEIVAGLLVVGAIVYAVLSSGEQQSWAEPRKDEQVNMSEVPEGNLLRNDKNGSV